MYHLDNTPIKRQKYYCKECNSQHFIDSDLGKEHMYKKPKIKQLSLKGTLGELEERAFWVEGEYAIVNHLNGFWKLYKKESQDKEIQDRFNTLFGKGRVWKSPNGEWRFYFNLDENERKIGRQTHLKEEKTHEEEWGEALKDPDEFLKKYQEKHGKKNK